MQFICVNQLGIRGNYDEDLDREGKIFLNLFEYTLMKDYRLRNIASTIPDNCKYTSVRIQNEIISILTEIMLEKIITQVFIDNLCNNYSKIMNSLLISKFIIDS